MNLRLTDLEFGYGETPVLNSVSFEINGAQFVSIIGPNGVGKSTLIHCINRILTPQAGKVEIDGRDVGDIPQKELAKLVGYVPYSSGTSFPMSVVDTVMLGRYPHSGSRRTEADLRKVHSVLRMLRIEDLSLRSFNELSAGQHQKVMLARGLAQETGILLLDEPTANLDIRHQMDVAHMLRDLSHAKGIIIVMICHDLNIASRYSDRIILLSEGRVFADGTPEEVITADNIERVYGVGCEVMEFEERPHVIICDSGEELVLFE